MTKEYIEQLKSDLQRCAKENENNRYTTPIFNVVVSSVCKNAVECIEELEKENAELKEKIEVLECDNYNANCNLNLITDQLTKAIELLKESQGYIENIDDILYNEIEQFLKEIEK